VTFVAAAHEHCLGRRIGSGHCVAFVRSVTDAPMTTHWRRGARVADTPTLARGTAIACFDADGRYGNHVDGRSHAAVLLAVGEDGLLVADQWTGQPVHERVIRYRNGAGDAANDGDRFFVIERETA
jgi:hypothetical protein